MSGNAACTGKMRIAYRVWVVDLKEGGHLEHRVVDGKILS